MSSTIDIDRIVREVVRRLQKQNEHAAVVGAGTEQRQTVSGGVLRLTNDVVTLAQVAERLSGVQQLVVTQHAVVTPAVRDELRAKQVVLVRDDARSAHTEIDRQKLRHALVVASDEPSYRGNDISWTGWEIQRVAAGDLASQLQQLEIGLEANSEQRTFGLFVTRRPYVVACTANRRPAFRAAVVGQAAETTEARETLDANLFVVRPLPPFRVNEILQAAQRSR